MTTRRARKTEPSVNATKRRSRKTDAPTRSSSPQTSSPQSSSLRGGGAEDLVEGEELPPSTRHVARANEGRRLETILRALPEKELGALVARMGIRIDAKKRIDGPAQIARALVRLPELREPSRLPTASEELLRRVAEANGSLHVSGLPNGIELLVRRGVVYARMSGDGRIELVLPTAFLVQLRSWEGEDPRSLRALLAEAPFETASAVASHYLGRPSTPPIALSLEAAWEVLGDRDTLRAEVERVSHQERRLLDQIEQIGGEVDTQELMDLEREPMRVRGAYGVAAGRRGAAFSLEKRGFLFPLHPNRYVVPTEVAAIIGAERLSERERRREEIRSHVIAADHLPRRARFSSDPAPTALSLTMGWHESPTEVKAQVGTPRSLITRLAQRFGRDAEATSMVIALSRAIGLWESEAVTAATPPGTLSLAELSLSLFETWRRGGTWDEARDDPEVLRVAPEQRDPSPVGVLREMVLDALQDLGEGQWVPLRALMAYIGDDPRRGGFERLLARWSKRVDVSPPALETIAQRILVQSLPALGVVDLGGSDRETASGSGELATVALRLTSRGRRMMAGRPTPPQPSEFVDPRRLAVGTAARVAEVLALGPFVEVTTSEGQLEVEITQASIAAGLALGVLADDMSDRLGALAPLPSALREVLQQAGTVIGRAELVAAGGFLWVDDVDVRKLLMTANGTSDLFLDPSPPGGLLIVAGVDPDRLARRCRAIGVDIQADAEVVRAVRHSTVPPPKRSSTHKAVNWRPPTRRSS
jgi:hypothetical protein